MYARMYVLYVLYVLDVLDVRDVCLYACMHAYMDTWMHGCIVCILCISSIFHAPQDPRFQNDATKITYLHMYIYIYIHIYVHILPKKWNRVDKSKGQSKTVEPFQQAVSLQDIEHSSKHAVFLSEEVQFSGNYSAFVQRYTFFLNLQYAVCDSH